MKNQLMYGCFGILMFSAGLISCGKDNSEPTVTSQKTEAETDYKLTKDGGITAGEGLLFTNGKPNPNGTDIGTGDKEYVFKGHTTLKKGVYTLKGWVYIADGAELTIAPGTVIKGDKATKASLIVERGGKLIAKGTQTSPIVFTSAQPKGQRKPGDWGGIILCGKAPNNQKEMQIEGGPRTKHGGQDIHDNSGVLSYVRIEFAGYPFRQDREINGLTFGSVGDKTQIDHIQVSYSNDDSYEWFGGTVCCKYLIAYHGWDDDFDTDNGYSGKVQFGLAIRDPRIADGSQSNSFESDNNAGGANVAPYTAATFSNMTFVGPMVDPTFKNDASYITGGAMFPNNGSAMGKFQAAMQIRRNSHLNCYNAVIMGYPIGLILDNEKGDTQKAATDHVLHVNNVWFAKMGVVGSDANKEYRDVLVTNYKPLQVDNAKKSFSSTWFKQQTGNNVYAEIAELHLQRNNYMPENNSPILNAANFQGLDSWFTSVPYIGAFAAGDTWMNGWTNFSPETTDY